MNKNPYLNAVLASAYIVVLVLTVNHFTQGTGDKSLLVPIVMLSLFVLSAALMGFLFVYTPAQLFLDNHRQEAIIFFFKTVGTFAGLAVVFVLLLLLR